jgi:hypothetical protein
MLVQALVPRSRGSAAGGPAAGPRGSGGKSGRTSSAFSGVQSNNYWSSTTNANSPNSALIFERRLEDNLLGLHEATCVRFRCPVPRRVLPSGAADLVVSRSPAGSRTDATEGAVPREDHRGPVGPRAERLASPRRHRELASALSAPTPAEPRAAALEPRPPRGLDRRDRPPTGRHRRTRPGSALGADRDPPRSMAAACAPSGRFADGRPLHRLDPGAGIPFPPLATISPRPGGTPGDSRERDKATSREFTRCTPSFRPRKSRIAATSRTRRDRVRLPPPPPTQTQRIRTHVLCQTYSPGLRRSRHVGRRSRGARP